MSKEGKTLIEYNIRNVVYSVDGSTVKPWTYASALSLSKSTETKDIYGDGELQLSILTDNGMTGNIDATARDTDFEKDLGFVMDMDNGTGEVSVVENKNISIGCEIYFMGADGVAKVKKKWFFGVQVAPASESLSQNTSSINESTASYGLTVRGVTLMDSTGLAEYKDENGVGRKCFSKTSKPGDSNYAAFLESVPKAAAKAAV